jgi:hypothetical protein
LFLFGSYPVRGATRGISNHKHSTAEPISIAEMKGLGLRARLGVNPASDDVPGTEWRLSAEATTCILMYHLPLHLLPSSINKQTKNLDPLPTN